MHIGIDAKLRAALEAVQARDGCHLYPESARLADKGTARTQIARRDLAHARNRQRRRRRWAPRHESSRAPREIPSAAIAGMLKIPITPYIGTSTSSPGGRAAPGAADGRRGGRLCHRPTDARVGVHSPSRRNFSPRLGVAWDVTGDGRSGRARGGALLYDVGVQRRRSCLVRGSPDGQRARARTQPDYRAAVIDDAFRGL